MGTTVTMTETTLAEDEPPVGDSACPTGLAFGDSDNDGLNGWLVDCDEDGMLTLQDPFSNRAKCHGAIDKTDGIHFFFVAAHFVHNCEPKSFKSLNTVIKNSERRLDSQMSHAVCGFQTVNTGKTKPCLLDSCSAHSLQTDTFDSPIFFFGCFSKVHGLWKAHACWFTPFNRSLHCQCK